MNELQKIVASFPNSLPVYKKVEKFENEVAFVLKKQWELSNDVTDPLQTLMPRYSAEIFDKQTFTIKWQVSYTEAYNAIVNTIKKVFLFNSDYKNPKQSKVYKWLSVNHYNNDALVDAFAYLYRYIKNKAIPTTFRTRADDHLKNVMTILELLRKKYDTKK